MNKDEAGSSLIEVVVSVALVAIALGAVFAGTVTAAHRFGPDPVQEALQQYVHSEMRIAVDVLKYEGAALSPAAIATTIPLAGASPFPAHVSLDVTPLAAGGAAVSISAQSDGDGKTASVQSVIAHPAPLPSSTVQTGLSVPAPVGAQ